MGRTENLGLRKLVEKTDLDLEALSAYHIGFVIGPCLNAGGRLQTAKMALNLLLSKEEEEADRLADELKALNDLRKDMTRKGEEEAVRQVEGTVTFRYEDGDGKVYEEARPFRTEIKKAQIVSFAAEEPEETNSWGMSVAAAAFAGLVFWILLLLFRLRKKNALLAERRGTQ